MCGICGVFNLAAKAAPLQAELEEMVSALHHRGPDESGVYVTEEAALANARLSIIDLPGGSQPMWNEDRTVCVVFNGEIYNHEELRGELQSRGHKLSTMADTEVIAHLYEEYGVHFPNHLNGMFAISLWDERRKQGLLVRDRLGIKPLYYGQHDERLVFASEIKAILKHSSFPRHVSQAGLDTYLALRYVPDDLTIFAAIHKLKPGHIVLCGPERGVEVTPYWKPSVQLGGRAVDEDEAEEELFRLLEDAVRIRLMSDVPFGAFLSGGLDSSGIVGLMSRLMGKERVKTFSIGFSEMPGLDERSHAVTAAQSSGTEHWEVDCTADRVEQLPLLLSHFDEPFADPIIVPTHQLSVLAREHVKVVLTGEGADELFGGYARFRRERLISAIAQMPPALYRSLAALLTHLPNNVHFDELRRAGHMLKTGKAERFAAWVTAFDALETSRLYGGARETESRAIETYGRYTREAGGDILDRMMYSEVKIRLPECMLSRTDRMTMAASLEGRTPFLDHRIVEWALNLPSSMKIRGNEEKYILRRALGRVVPRSILDRRKQGLAVPFAQWTRYGIEKHIRRILSPGRVNERGLFHPPYVARLLDHWEPQAARHSQLIWSLFCLELWFRLYVDEPALDPQTPLSAVA